MPDWIGKSLGKYQITALLGRGGMAEVYQAFHPGLNRQVAIKILHPFLSEDAGLQARFKREAEAVARLRHPHIVQVYDFDIQEDQLYMVMELIEGKPLDALAREKHLAGQSFNLVEIARLFIDLAGAIDYAHRHGVIHRDLKPSNMLLTSDGHVILTDFGLAHFLDAARLTGSGNIIGTPAYMSPEQCQGLSGDVSSDIYTLGVILYELLTGCLPFTASNPLAILSKHIYDPVPSPTQINPNLPLSVEAVILKALNKLPTARYQSAGEMAAALCAAAGLPAASVPENSQPTPRTPTLEPPCLPAAAPVGTGITPFQPPPDTGRFIGRTRQLAELSAAIPPSEGFSVHCLTGMGGIGKSALAVHLAHQLRPHFPDGVLWANSASSEPMAILDSWARAFSHDFSSLPDLDSRAAAIRSLLADKRLLIVIDDARNAEAVRPLLLGGKRCSVIITTRDVELAVALNAHIHPLEALTLEESRLFLADILKESRLSAEPEAADELCLLLGNLPLALEIAAGRLESRRRWRLADLVERLKDEQRRLAELRLGDREVRASFTLSWKDLSPELRRLFACLAPFESRSFTAPAAAAAASLDLFETGDRLQALAARSLLFEEGAEAYRQHPLLADFAREQLGADDRPYILMAGYYRDFARAHSLDFTALEAQWSNLWAGLRAAHSCRQWNLVQDYARALRAAWFAYGHFSEARLAFGWAVEAAQSLQDETVQAEFEQAWGKACLEQKGYEEARTHLSASLGLWASLGNRLKLAEDQISLARIDLEQYRYDEALQRIQESRRIREELGDRVGIAETYYAEARVSYFRADYTLAAHLGRQALLIQQEAREAYPLILTLNLLASTAIEKDDLDTAERFGMQALELCERSQNRGEQAAILDVLSDISRHKGQFDQAQVHAEQGLELLRVTGDLGAQALALYQLSMILESKGEVNQALQVGLQSLDLAKQLDYQLLITYVLIHLGDVHMRLKLPSLAKSQWQEALMIAGRLENPTAAEESQRRLQEHFPGSN